MNAIDGFDRFCYFHLQKLMKLNFAVSSCTNLATYFNMCKTISYQYIGHFQPTSRDANNNREDICLQILLFLFKFANHRNKRTFVLSASEALVGTSRTIGDVNDILPVEKCMTSGG